MPGHGALWELNRGHARTIISASLRHKTSFSHELNCSDSAEQRTDVFLGLQYHRILSEGETRRLELITLHYSPRSRSRTVLSLQLCARSPCRRHVKCNKYEVQLPSQKLFTWKIPIDHPMAFGIHQDEYPF